MGKKYDESTVLSLDALAHIRLRSGMYIGRLGDGSHPDVGIYIMLKEVIDNSVDEFIMHNGKEILIELNEKTSSLSYDIPACVRRIINVDSQEITIPSGAAATK